MTVLVYASPVRVRVARVISTCVCMCCQILTSHGKEPPCAHAWRFPWPQPYSEARCRCQPPMVVDFCCEFRREPRTARRSDYEGRVCLFWARKISVVTSTLK